MRRRIVVSLALVLVAGAVTLWAWPVSDAAMRKSVLGTWRAVDPNNGALHKRTSGVSSEQATFQADGTARYQVDAQPQNGASKTEQWRWRIEDGRLLLAYAGEGSAEEWLPSLKFTLSGAKLAIYRKNFPAKEFVRINE